MTSESGAAASDGTAGFSPDTSGEDYAERLVRLEQARWKQALDVQAPYRWFVRKHVRGRVLEVGCGTGRVLAHLRERAVGVDHNPHSIAEARTRGLVAYDSTEFPSSPEARPGSFDTLLLAHVVEHMQPHEAVALIGAYRHYLRRGGEIFLIVPQQQGFRTDPTHVTYFDDATLRRLLGDVGTEPLWTRSFPFPRPVGHVFPYNETIGVGRLTTG